ncbi:hypothetical protein PG993_008972 [Apiospora rasikravindrae]|uniref:Uncharacterized protein n=1 Tax=Apiospora rasikravindrae TaxID=990691 RepID=A0ABR1SI35_9PEZI
MGFLLGATYALGRRETFDVPVSVLDSLKPGQSLGSDAVLGLLATQAEPGWKILHPAIGDNQKLHEIFFDPQYTKFILPYPSEYVYKKKKMFNLWSLILIEQEQNEMDQDVTGFNFHFIDTTGALVVVGLTEEVKHRLANLIGCDLDPPAERGTKRQEVPDASEQGFADDLVELGGTQHGYDLVEGREGDDATAIRRSSAAPLARLERLVLPDLFHNLHDAGVAVDGNAQFDDEGYHLGGVCSVVPPLDQPLLGRFRRLPVFCLGLLLYQIPNPKDHEGAGVEGKGGCESLSQWLVRALLASLGIFVALLVSLVDVLTAILRQGLDTQVPQGGALEFQVTGHKAIVHHFLDKLIGELIAHLFLEDWGHLLG